MRVVRSYSSSSTWKTSLTRHSNTTHIEARSDTVCYVLLLFLLSFTDSQTTVSSKVKRLIMSAILISKRSGMARINEGSQSYLPLTRLSTNEMSHSAFTPQPQSVTALWPVLIFRPVQGRRLSWCGWLVTYRGGTPARRRSPIPVLTGLGVK